MAGRLRLEVLTKDGMVFSSDVQELQFPTAHRGYYGILPEHTPVLTPIGDGQVSCLVDGRTTVLDISGGFAEVGPDRVTLLAGECNQAK
jgi:F-type H+-transporting ATPase subunit epsilon